MKLIQGRTYCGFRNLFLCEDFKERIYPHLRENKDFQKFLNGYIHDDTEDYIRKNKVMDIVCEYFNYGYFDGEDVFAHGERFLGYDAEDADACEIRKECEEHLKFLRQFCRQPDNIQYMTLCYMDDNIY